MFFLTPQKMKRPLLGTTILISAFSLGNLFITYFPFQIIEGPKIFRGEKSRVETEIRGTESFRSQICTGHLDLLPYSDQYSTSKLFFLETSKRSILNPRQACAVESAAKMTSMEIIVMIWSEHLSLEDNVTCNLYNHNNVHFHRIVPEIDFEETPLGAFHKEGGFNSSKYPSTHFSDALRIAYVFKHGGWYADLDYLFIKSLLDLPPSVLGAVTGPTSSWLTNSIFRMEAPYNALARMYLQGVRTHFRGHQRTSIGPWYLTDSFRKHCKLSKSFEFDSLNNSDTGCDGFTITHPQVFNYVPPGKEGILLWKKFPVQPEVWNELFKYSKGVHFFSSSTRDLPVTDPTRHAYAYLAAQFCPLSYHGAEVFHGSYVS